jgi:hypothetical protein
MNNASNERNDDDIDDGIISDSDETKYDAAGKQNAHGSH